MEGRDQGSAEVNQGRGCGNGGRRGAVVRQGGARAAPLLPSHPPHDSQG